MIQFTGSVMPAQFGSIRSLIPAASVLAIPAFVLAGCSEPPPATAKPSSAVRVIKTKAISLSSSVSLTGQIAARVQSDLGFRIQGRIASRNVEVGERVSAGQVLATLETTQAEADVASARAGVASAEATLREARSTFQRQRTLLGQGFTTQPNFDNAKQALDGAEASLVTAKSALGTADDTFSNTQLRADVDGVVTARSAEVGQVVDVAQVVYSVAQDGPRDAVFDVYEALLTRPPPENGVEVALVSDPSVRAVGKARETSPTVDASKGTVRVKIGLDAPPAQMSLGAAVTGIGSFQPRDVVVVPWTAFFYDRGRPAVWVVDPARNTVSLKGVEVETYRTGDLVLRAGLNGGEQVVTHGGQLLFEGETVTARTEAPASDVSGAR